MCLALPSLWAPHPPCAPWTHHFLETLLGTLGSCMTSWSLMKEESVVNLTQPGPVVVGQGLTAPGTYLGEFRSAFSGAALGLWIPSRRALRCCSCKARRRGVAAAADAPGPPGPPRPPKTHLLGLQEIGVPQLADDHLTLLNRGVLTQVGGQAHQGGCPHHLLAFVLAACH